MPFPFFGSSAPASSSTTPSPTSDPSSSSTSPAAAALPELAPEAAAAKRYEAILKDETEYQDMQYPTTEEVPGCMKLFDQFLSCYALFPQMRSFYRYGDFHDCTWRLQDFKHCLSLKSEDPEAKRELWIKRRAEWWAKRRVERSSEDVWDLRTEKLSNFPPLGEEVTSEESTA
ncbi:hypothetical protein IAT38_003491 [Cryptococcus sp. DSM 104549]